MQIRKITKLCGLTAIISLTLIFQFCQKSFALDNNALDDNLNKLPDTVKSAAYVKTEIDFKKTESEADKFFYAGIETQDKKLKEAYLSKALVKYMLLLSVNPGDAIICTQIGVIHDKLGHSKLAKDYLLRAVNLDNLNPFPNFYFGEYYNTRRDYENALKYYKVAYNNGYSSYYEINVKLGTIYEKLGDIEKAKYYYRISKKQNPNVRGLGSKIMSLNKVYYSKSDYKK